MKHQHLKRSLTLFIGAVLAAIIFVFAIALWSLMAFEERIPYLNSTSPTGRYQIELDYSPPFVFGSHTVYVYARNLSATNTRWLRLRPRRVHVGTFSVANDGKSIEGNCDVQWLHSRDREIVEITCNGEEQGEETHSMAVQTALD